MCFVAFRTTKMAPRVGFEPTTLRLTDDTLFFREKQRKKARQKAEMKKRVKNDLAKRTMPGGHYAAVRPCRIVKPTPEQVPRTFLLIADRRTPLGVASRRARGEQRKNYRELMKKQE